MTALDAGALAGMAARHVPDAEGDDRFCRACGQRAPCDARLLLDALAASDAALAALADTADRSRSMSLSVPMAHNDEGSFHRSQVMSAIGDAQRTVDATADAIAAARARVAP